MANANNDCSSEMSNGERHSALWWLEQQHTVLDGEGDEGRVPVPSLWLAGMRWSQVAEHPSAESDTPMSLLLRLMSPLTLPKAGWETDAINNVPLSTFSPCVYFLK